jgi:hypothetical protein
MVAAEKIVKQILRLPEEDPNAAMKARYTVVGSGAQDGFVATWRRASRALLTPENAPIMRVLTEEAGAPRS